MNATMISFGHPETLVHAYQHWSVLLRRKQITLGSLVLVCHEDVERFSDLSTAAFEEFPRAVQGIERTLSAAFAYDKINYLMLMMVDPHVHFHVLPRYSGPRMFDTVELGDSGWPGPPALAAAWSLPKDTEIRLGDHLRERWLP